MKKKKPEDFQGHFLQDAVEECKPILMSTNNAPELMAGTKKHIRKQFQSLKEKGSSYASLYQLAITIALLNNILKLEDSASYPFKIIPEIGIIAIFNFHIQVLKKWLWDNAEKIIPIPKNISFNSKNHELSIAINNFINNFYKTWLVKRLEIGTVERFEGREKKIIIRNTVYNSVYNYNRLFSRFIPKQICTQAP